jgi:hypothetical protein
MFSGSGGGGVDVDEILLTTFYGLYSRDISNLSCLPVNVAGRRVEDGVGFRGYVSMTSSS